MDEKSNLNRFAISISPTGDDAGIPPNRPNPVISYLQLRTARELVDAYLDGHAIRVDIDGNPAREKTTETFEARISRRPIDEKILQDEIAEFCHDRNLPFKRVDITRAVKLVLFDRAEHRRLEILRPLCEAQLTETELERAEGEFKRFSKIIDIAESLSIPILKQFMWLFKRKQTRHTVHYPIMLIFFNAIQGSGKSWFVERLIGPLQELASDSIPFSEIADPRSSGLQKNGVVYLDDIGGAVSRKLLGAFKSAITSPSSKRRDLGKSRQSRHEHDAVFIATTNQNIHHLIPDDTGHRRFAVLPFKNGAVEKGGSKEVWHIVDNLDYELMWKSVSEAAEAPIKPVLTELYEFQQSYVPPHPLDVWLSKLDFGSEAVRDVTGPYGVTPEDLLALYCAETGDIMSETAFGKAMNERNRNGTLPFGKTRTADGNFYFEKSPKSGVIPTVAAV